MKEGYEDQTLGSKPCAILDRHSTDRHTEYFTDTKWSLNRQWMDTCQTLGGNWKQDGHSIDTGWTLGAQRIDTGETHNRHWTDT